jgi:hypothetical protein
MANASFHHPVDCLAGHSRHLAAAVAAVGATVAGLAVWEAAGQLGSTLSAGLADLIVAMLRSI